MPSLEVSGADSLTVELRRIKAEEIGLNETEKYYGISTRRTLGREMKSSDISNDRIGTWWY